MGRITRFKRIKDAERFFNSKRDAGIVVGWLSDRRRGVDTALVQIKARGVLMMSGGKRGALGKGIVGDCVATDRLRSYM